MSEDLDGAARRPYHKSDGRPYLEMSVKAEILKTETLKTYQNRLLPLMA
jgi:hypothetical protein